MADAELSRRRTRSQYKKAEITSPFQSLEVPKRTKAGTKAKKAEATSSQPKTSSSAKINKGASRRRGRSAAPPSSIISAQESVVKTEDETQAQQLSEHSHEQTETVASVLSPPPSAEEMVSTSDERDTPITTEDELVGSTSELEVARQIAQDQQNAVQQWHTPTRGEQSSPWSTQPAILHYAVQQTSELTPPSQPFFTYSFVEQNAVDYSPSILRTPSREDSASQRDSAQTISTSPSEQAVSATQDPSVHLSSPRIGQTENISGENLAHTGSISTEETAAPAVMEGPEPFVLIAVHDPEGNVIDLDLPLPETPVAPGADSLRDSLYDPAHSPWSFSEAMAAADAFLESAAVPQGTASNPISLTQTLDFAPMVVVFDFPPVQEATPIKSSGLVLTREEELLVKGFRARNRERRAEVQTGNKPETTASARPRVKRPFADIDVPTEDQQSRRTRPRVSSDVPVAEGMSSRVRQNRVSQRRPQYSMTPTIPLTTISQLPPGFRGDTPNSRNFWNFYGVANFDPPLPAMSESNDLEETASRKKQCDEWVQAYNTNPEPEAPAFDLSMTESPEKTGVSLQKNVKEDGGLENTNMENVSETNVNAAQAQTMSPETPRSRGWVGSLTSSISRVFGSKFGNRSDEVVANEEATPGRKRKMCSSEPVSGTYGVPTSPYASDDEDADAGLAGPSVLKTTNTSTSQRPVKRVRWAEDETNDPQDVSSQQARPAKSASRSKGPLQESSANKAAGAKRQISRKRRSEKKPRKPVQAKTKTITVKKIYGAPAGSSFGCPDDLLDDSNSDMDIEVEDNGEPHEILVEKAKKKQLDQLQAVQDARRADALNAKQPMKPVSEYRALYGPNRRPPALRHGGRGVTYDFESLQKPTPEQKREAEEKKLADEARQAEEKRLADEKRQAEEEKQADEKRQAEEKSRADEKRREDGKKPAMAPPPTPKPAHATLPADALAKARSQAEKYKPKQPSSLRTWSRLSQSTSSESEQEQIQWPSPPTARFSLPGETVDPEVVRALLAIPQEEIEREAALIEWPESPSFFPLFDTEVVDAVMRSL